MGKGESLHIDRSVSMRQQLTSRCNVLQTQAISDPISPLRIINTSTWDIEIHYYLTNPTLHTQPTIPTSLSWVPLTSSTDHDLLQYCKLPFPAFPYH
jgi:hypothetical protein